MAVLILVGLAFAQIGSLLARTVPLNFRPRRARLAALRCGRCALFALRLSHDSQA